MTSTNSQAEAIVTNLTEMVVNLVTEETITPEQQVALANAYQAVHVSRRGAIQAQVLLAAMSTPEANQATLGAILETFTNVATLATGTRKVSEENVTLTQALALSAIYVANMALADKVSAEAIILASVMVAEGVPSEHLDKVLAQASRMVEAMTEAPKGTRRSFKDTLGDLIERGDVTLGDVITDSDGNEACILGHEAIEVEGVTYTSLSDAAQAITGHSTNGWAHFLVTNEADEQVAIGTLRQA